MGQGAHGTGVDITSLTVYITTRLLQTGQKSQNHACSSPHTATSITQRQLTDPHAHTHLVVDVHHAQDHSHGCITHTLQLGCCAPWS